MDYRSHVSMVAVYIYILVHIYMSRLRGFVCRCALCAWSIVAVYKSQSHNFWYTCNRIIPSYFYFRFRIQIANCSQIITHTQTLSKPGCGNNVTERGVVPTSSGCKTGDRTTSTGTTDLKRSAVMSGYSIHCLGLEKNGIYTVCGTATAHDTHPPLDGSSPCT